MGPRRVLPMFPLEHALLPYAPLPLHIFEERYRAMVKHCLAGEREFGVVLIERGREVGGGDQRFAVGTLAGIVKAVELPDGGYLMHAVGIDRLRVDRWLEDDPYPAAEITMLADEEPGPDADAVRLGAERLLRQVLALRAELGLPAPAAASVALADDPSLASYQATMLAGFGPFDTQRILEADGPGARLGLVSALLADERDDLTRRITQG